MSNPVAVLVRYRPKAGKEDDLLALLRQHWPTLDRLGLVTKEPAKIWRAVDKKSGRVSFVEWMEWKDDQSSNVAHQTPEVMAVWEPMGPILEDLEIQHVEPVH